MQIFFLSIMQLIIWHHSWISYITTNIYYIHILLQLLQNKYHYRGLYKENITCGKKFIRNLSKENINKFAFNSQHWSKSLEIFDESMNVSTIINIWDRLSIDDNWRNCKQENIYMKFKMQIILFWLNIIQCGMIISTICFLINQTILHDSCDKN